MTIACIFCGSKGPFKSTSHIVPESLGGPNSLIAPAGITCDVCNQYFGQKIECKALGSFPFSIYRTINSVPTKKGKMTSIQADIGAVHASGKPGTFAVDPSREAVAIAIQNDEITSFRIVAEVTEPLASCRMLIKMGLELLAKHSYGVATSDRVSHAVTYARRPKRGDGWWFALHLDPEKVITAHQAPGEDAFSVEIIERGGLLCSIFRLPGITALTPLEQCHPISSLPDGPLYRLIQVTC